MSVEQYAAHYSLNYFDFSLETVGDSSRGSWLWASLPYFYGAMTYGECCGLGVIHACTFEVLF